MATKYIKRGTADNWHAYDDADTDSSFIVEDPITGVDAIELDNYVTLRQLLTSVISTDAEAYFYSLEF